LKKYVFLILCAAFMAGCASVHLNISPVSQNQTVEESDANGVATWAILPPSYNPQIANPWIIYNHGIGQSIASVAASPPQSNFVHSLTTAGFVVIASNYRDLACWGNQECVEDISNLQTLWRSRLNLSPRPFVIGESMGGIVTWNAISHGALKPMAVVGIYPVCNLKSVYSERAFVPTIQTAYDFALSSGYSAATKGFDPMLASPSTFVVFPIQIWASYRDHSVFRSQNADAFAQAINAAGGTVTVNTSRGRHGDPSNFDAAAVIAFFSSFRS
jgi:pimeloyl-ACP methyl ester carboxylesterase